MCGKQNAMHWKSVVAVPTVAAAVAIAAGGGAAADEPSLESVLQAPSAELLEKRTIVLRVSKAFIRQHTPAVVDRRSPVDRCLFGARVSGTAITNGRPVMVRHGDENNPKLNLHFRGTIDTRTVAVKGPVRVCSSGHAVFDVHRVIFFDGFDFREGPETVDLSFTSSLDGIGTPPGLRGRIVRRVAVPQINRQRSAADAISRDDIRRAVLEEFGRHTDKLVRDLNANLPWKQTVAMLTKQTPGRKRQFINKPQWIEAHSSHTDNPSSLPDGSEEMRAPVELWVLGEPRASISDRLVELWGASQIAFNRIRRTLTTAEGRDASGLEPEMVGDWWVIRIGDDVASRVLGSPAAPSSDAARD